MEIYLMRHGQALAEEVDPERPLSPEGIAQIQASAKAMKRLGIRPGLILCSPKKRSRQTAALVAEGINYPYSDILRDERVGGGTSPQEGLQLLREHEGSGALFLAGHLPMLPRLASLLLSGEAGLDLEFDSGGLCRLDAEALEPGRATLAWLASAKQMALMGAGR